MNDWQPCVDSVTRRMFPNCFAVKADELGATTAVCIPPDGEPGLYAWGHDGKVWLAEQSTGVIIGRVIRVYHDFLIEEI